VGLVAIGLAFYYRNAIVESFLTVAVLGAAFFGFRRCAPFPFVRLCVSVMILFQAIEAIDVARNERACPRMRMANAIRAKGVAGNAVAIHKPALALAAAPEEQKRIVAQREKADRLRTVLSFYFNRLLATGEDLEKLIADRAVRAIIMDKAVGARLLAEPALASKGDVLALDAREPDVVLFVKTND
jgi:hypothetical protein